MRAAAAAALTSGVLLWLASPAVGLGWLAWAAVVPAALAALALREPRARRLAVPLAYAVYLELLLIPGLPFGVAEGELSDPPLPVMVDDSPVLFVALAAVPLFAAALYGLRFGEPWGAHRLPPRAQAAALVGVPALAWTALDFARVNLDPGGLFGPPFASQHDLPTARLAALGGPWLVTLAIAAVGYAVALAIVRRSAAAGAGAAALAAAVVLGVAAAPDPAGGRAITVAAVQPGYHTPEDDHPKLRFFRRETYGLAALDTIDDLGSLTREAAARGAEIVGWPEAAIWVDPRRRPFVAAPLRSVARETGVTLAVPIYLRDDEGGGTLVVTPDGETAPPQWKRRPMWFLGEAGGASGTPEPSAGVGALLGLDNQDPHNAAELAGRRTDVIVSATHDWRQLAVHQRAFAQVGAVAAGTPVVRSDWRFGSAVYDARGRKVADAGTAKRRTVVVARVRAGGETPYAAIGDAVGWLAVAAAAAAAVAGRLGGAAARSAPSSWPGRPPAPSPRTG